MSARIQAPSIQQIAAVMQRRVQAAHVGARSVRRATIGDPRPAGQPQQDLRTLRRAIVGLRNDGSIHPINDPNSPCYKKPLIDPSTPLICAPGNLPACNATLPAKVTVAVGASTTLTFDMDIMNWSVFRAHGMIFYGPKAADAVDLTGLVEITAVQHGRTNYIGSNAGMNCAFFSAASNNALELYELPDLKQGARDLEVSLTSIATTAGDIAVMYALLYGEAVV